MLTVLLLISAVILLLLGINELNTSNQCVDSNTRILNELKKDIALKQQIKNLTKGN